MKVLLFTLAIGLACSLAAPAAGEDSLAWVVTTRYAPASRSVEIEPCAREAHASVTFVLAGNAGSPGIVPRREHGSFEPTREGWQASAWKAGECARFNVDLDSIAGDRRARGSGASGAAIADPRQWLWLPDSLGSASTIQFALPAGYGVSVPWRRLADADGQPRYALGSDPVDGPALTAFGEFEEIRMRKPGGVLRVAILAPRDSALARRLHAWIDGIATVALTANGRLPLRDAQVLVVPVAGSSSATPWGEVQRGGGSALHLYPGAMASAAALRADWTATHEIAHLFHPYLGTRGRWLGEGLASYYQNVLRARAGWLEVDDAVGRLRAGFERGRREATTAGMTPSAASAGMHRQRAYMRVYWSGAAYWLTVDARLRRDHGTSLDAVLARYSACCLRGGDVAAPERFIADLDRLSTTRVFSVEFVRASRTTAFPDARALDALLDEPALRTAIFAPRG